LGADEALPAAVGLASIERMRLWRVPAWTSSQGVGRVSAAFNVGGDTLSADTVDGENACRWEREGCGRLSGELVGEDVVVGPFGTGIDC